MPPAARSHSAVTVQVPHRFILKKYLSEIDSEGHTDAVFEKSHTAL